MFRFDRGVADPIMFSGSTLPPGPFVFVKIYAPLQNLKNIFKKCTVSDLPMQAFLIASQYRPSRPEPGASSMESHPLRYSLRQLRYFVVTAEALSFTSMHDDMRIRCIGKSFSLYPETIFDGYS
jgi:hypothetical protein